MKFLRFLLDTIYDLYQYILIVLIVLVMFFVLKSTITEMFTTDYNQVEAGQGDEAQFTDTKEPEDDAPEIRLTIPEGFSLLDISKVLIDSKVITDEEAFVLYVKDQGKEDVFGPGNYAFTKNMDFDDVIAVFENGGTQNTEESVEEQAE